MSKKSIWFAMATFTLTIVGLASKAQAVGIDYRTLETGVSQEDAIYSNSKGSDDDRFSGNKGDVTIVAKSIDSALDPTLKNWEDLATDTDRFSNVFDSNDSELSQVAFADNETVELGLYGENQTSFTLPTKDYTVALSDPNKDSTTETLKEVPEPLTILGSLTAIGIGGFLKRKYSLNSQIKEEQN